MCKANMDQMIHCCGTKEQPKGQEQITVCINGMKPIRTCCYRKIIYFPLPVSVIPPTYNHRVAKLCLIPYLSEHAWLRMWATPIDLTSQEMKNKWLEQHRVVSYAQTQTQ